MPEGGSWGGNLGRSRVGRDLRIGCWLYVWRLRVRLMRRLRNQIRTWRLRDRHGNAGSRAGRARFIDGQRGESHGHVMLDPGSWSGSAVDSSPLDVSSVGGVMPEASFLALVFSAILSR